MPWLRSTFLLLEPLFCCSLEGLVDSFHVEGTTLTVDAVKVGFSLDCLISCYKFTASEGLVVPEVGLAGQKHDEGVGTGTPDLGHPLDSIKSTLDVAFIKETLLTGLKTMIKTSALL